MTTEDAVFAEWNKWDCEVRSLLERWRGEIELLRECGAEAQVMTLQKAFNNLLEIAPYEVEG